MGNATDDNHRSGEQGLGEQSRAKWPRLPILVAAAFSLVTLLVGLSTEVWIGDEAHHYWVALSYLRADGRVAIASGADPAWAASESYLFTEPLWPYILSRIWSLAGDPSFALAQLYQAGWFFAFLVGFYLVVRNYCTEKAAIWSMVLAASMPMIAAFGTLFYLDVPMLAVLVWALYFAHRRGLGWTFLCGVLAGGVYLTKRTGVGLLMWVAFVALLQSAPGWKQRTKTALVGLLPFALIVALDVQYRLREFQSATMWASAAIPTAARIEEYLAPFRPHVQRPIHYEFASVLQPVEWCTHVGPVVLLGLGLYLCRLLLRGFNRKDVFFLCPACLYSALFIAFFTLKWNMTDPRYFLPAVVFVIPLAGQAVAGIGSRGRGWWLRLTVLAVAVLQFVGILYYVHQKRHRPEPLQEAYQFIRTRLPDDNKTFVANGHTLEVYTSRLSIFWALRPGILFQTNVPWETKRRVLDTLNVGYFLVREDCVYDDRGGHVVLDASAGYPRSLIGELDGLAWFQKIFENEMVTLWRYSGGEEGGGPATGNAPPTTGGVLRDPRNAGKIRALVSPRRESEWHEARSAL